MCNLRVMAMAFVLLGAAGCGPTQPADAPVSSATDAPPGDPAAGGPTVGSGGETKEDKAADAPKPAEPAAAAPDPSGKGGATPQNAMAEGSALTGTLTKHEIRAIVLKHGELFDTCYTIGAGKSKEFVATVTVKATIGPSGVVNDTKIVGSTAKNTKVDACVADAFKKIKFPVPKNGATSTITFPMEFQGVEEVKD